MLKRKLEDRCNWQSWFCSADHGLPYIAYNSLEGWVIFISKYQSIKGDSAKWRLKDLKQSRQIETAENSANPFFSPSKRFLIPTSPPHNVNISRTASKSSMSANEGLSTLLSTHIPRIQPCRLCQQRKVKCDRKDPCTNCSKAGVECILAAPGRRKNKPVQDSELLTRLKRYEDALRGYGADVDKIAKGQSIPRDHVATRERKSIQRHQDPRERLSYLEK